MGLDDGAGAAAHHRQVHHQGEGFPIHQIGGGAVVGTGEILSPLDPIGAADPQPAAGRQGLLLLLHPPQQLHLIVVEVAEAPQALQVAFSHRMPALATRGGLTGIGAIKNRVSRRGGGGEIVGPIALGEALRTLSARALPARSRACGIGRQGAGGGQGHGGRASSGSRHLTATGGGVKQQPPPSAAPQMVAAGGAAAGGGLLEKTGGCPSRCPENLTISLPQQEDADTLHCRFFYPPHASPFRPCRLRFCRGPRRFGSCWHAGPGLGV